MPHNSPQKFDKDQILEDIKYVNQSVKTEISTIQERLLHCISEEAIPKETATSLIREVATQLGQLTAKVAATETAIRTLSGNQKLKTRVKPVANNSTSKIQVENNRFTATQLAGGSNLLPLEFSAGSLSYVWSGVNPKIRFEFSLDRSNKLGMKIFLFALIKPEYLKQLKVLVNETHIKHMFGIENELFVVSCVLPSSNMTGPTDIKIVLPDTHSPMELGNSKDDRKLGIAISEIRFGKPESRFTHVLKRLKLKS